MSVNAMKWEYIGDGVYAGFDGRGYWLHANSHDQPTDRIYPDPEVLTDRIYLHKEVLRALIELEDARAADSRRGRADQEG